jgi:hypothetical protein
MTGSVLLFAQLPINPPIGLTNSLEVWLWEHGLVALLSPPPIDPESRAIRKLRRTGVVELH